jgi:hypothetical protein
VDNPRLLKIPSRKKYPFISLMKRQTRRTYCNGIEKMMSDEILRFMAEQLDAGQSLPEAILAVEQKFKVNSKEVYRSLAYFERRTH